MTNFSIECLLPIATSTREHSSNDINRALLMLHTLSMRFKGEGKLNINIVSPSRDLENLVNHLPEAPNLKFRLIDEQTLFENPLPRVDGTYIQQLIKLYAFKIIHAEYVLCLDADLIVCSDFDWNDLIVDGKANSWVASELEHLEHPQWWQGSKEILNSDIDINSMKFRLEVTPNILSTFILKKLSSEVLGSYGCTLEEHLFNNLSGWTEYTLYSIYAEENRLSSQYHWMPASVGANLVDRFGSVWIATQAQNLEVHLQRHAAGIFRIYQSNSYVDLNRLMEFYGTPPFKRCP